MIFDKIVNYHYYVNTHPLFEKAFEYVENYLKDPVAPGIYEICGKDLFVKVQDYETREEGFFEVHDQYIDIQCMVEGAEMVYYTEREGLIPAAPYDAKEDAQFLLNRDDCLEFLFRAGEMAVFFPNDAHKPAMQITEKARAKKLVFKVKI